MLGLIDGQIFYRRLGCGCAPVGKPDHGSAPIRRMKPNISRVSVKLVWLRVTKSNLLFFDRDLIIKLYETFDCGDFKAVKDMLFEKFVAHLVGMSATLNRDEFTEFGTKFR
jgi:hypothetical protein